MLGNLGQQPFAWLTPDGYPDVATAWQSPATALARWNAHICIAAKWWPKEFVLPPLRKLLPATLPATHAGLVDALATRLVWRPLAPEHRDAVLLFLGKNGTAPVTEDSEAVGWRLPYLVALILDSPYHLLR